MCNLSWWCVFLVLSSGRNVRLVLNVGNLCVGFVSSVCSYVCLVVCLVLVSVYSVCFGNVLLCLVLCMVISLLCSSWLIVW